MGKTVEKEKIVEELDVDEYKDALDEEVVVTALVTSPQLEKSASQATIDFEPVALSDFLSEAESELKERQKSGDSNQSFKKKAKVSYENVPDCYESPPSDHDPVIDFEPEPNDDDLFEDDDFNFDEIEELDDVPTTFGSDNHRLSTIPELTEYAGSMSGFNSIPNSPRSKRREMISNINSSSQSNFKNMVKQNRNGLPPLPSVEIEKEELVET